MKALALAMFVLVPFAAIAADAPVSPKALKHPPGPKLEITVKPAAGGAYLVSTAISDRLTGEVFASPSLTVEPGVWATVEITASEGRPASSLAVTVAPDGQGAAYFATFRRESGITDTQSGTLIIAR
jgi:hypothetical protein